MFLKLSITLEIPFITEINKSTQSVQGEGNLTGLIMRVYCIMSMFHDVRLSTNLLLSEVLRCINNACSVQLLQQFLATHSTPHEAAYLLTRLTRYGSL